MSTSGQMGEPTRRSTITIGVEREMAPRFAVGARREVDDSSLDSLWYGRSTVTLRRVEDGDDDEDSE